MNHGHLGLHTNNWKVCEEDRTMAVAADPVSSYISKKSVKFLRGTWGKI